MALAPNAIVMTPPVAFIVPYTYHSDNIINPADLRGGGDASPKFDLTCKIYIFFSGNAALSMNKLLHFSDITCSSHTIKYSQYGRFHYM